MALRDAQGRFVSSGGGGGGGGGGGVKAGSAYVEIGTDLRKFNVGMGKARETLQSFAKVVAKVGVGVSALGGAIAAPLVQSVRSFARYGDEQAKAAKRTGITARAMSELSYVAGLAGGDISMVEGAIRGMHMAMRMLRRGEGQAVEEFKAMGLAVQDLEGLSIEDRFFRIAEAIATFKDETRRGELAMTAFSRSGMRMLPMLSMGADGIRDARQNAHLLGIALSDQAAEAAEAFTDRMLDLKMALQGIKNTIGMLLIDPVMDFTKKLLDMMVVFRLWLRENPQIVTGAAKLAKWMLIIGTALTTIGSSLAFVLSKFGLVILGATAMGASILNTLEKHGLIDMGIGDITGGLSDSIKGVLPILETVANALKNALMAAGKEFVALLMDGLRLLSGIAEEMLLGFKMGTYDLLADIRIMGQPVIDNPARKKIEAGIDAALRQAERHKLFTEIAESYREQARGHTRDARFGFGAAGTVIGELIANIVSGLRGTTREDGGGYDDMMKSLTSTSGVVGFFGGQGAAQFMGQAQGGRVEQEQLSELKKLNQTAGEINKGLASGVTGAYA